MTAVNWIPGLPFGRLGLMPRPRGGDWLREEIEALTGQGVQTLVSFLGPFEASELELIDEAHECRLAGIDFVSFPVSDRSLPDSSDKAFDLVRDIADRLERDQTVVLHCRLGIGRAGMFSAATLIAIGDSAPAASERVSKARGIQVPDTPAQVEWLQNFERQVRGEPE